MKKKDEIGGKFALISTPKVSEEQRAYIESYFDAETDKDIRDMNSLEETQRILKKYLLARIIAFPIHWLALRVLLGRKDAKALTRLTKSFWKAIRTPHMEPETITKFLDYCI